MLPNAKRLMANMSQGLEVPIRGDPTTRYAEYLPFRFDDGKSHSITAYCSPRGVRCIEIDGDTQRRLGTPSESCCPITHYLRPYETVQSVHAVGSGMRDMYSEVGFFLMVRDRRSASLKGLISLGASYSRVITDANVWGPQFILRSLYRAN